jgi:hydrogenase/urease accessory protein HupE
MKRRSASLLLAIGILAAQNVLGHEAPTSFIDLHITEPGLDVELTASTIDLAHDLPTIEPDMLLQSPTLEKAKAALGLNLLSRLTITADGQTLTGELTGIQPLPEKRDLKMSFHFGWQRIPKGMHVQARLFPYDPRHRTFANFYKNQRLERQEILASDRTSVDYLFGSPQGPGEVVTEFLVAGVHHIFIGPDHIFFIVGLLLLGGSLGQLLRIVTAFTVAHSITLGLATLEIVSPPPALIEPAIAFTIVVVGFYSLFGRKVRDSRIIFAFGFGLIHGFGFANALREMMLPREALGWSLFAFNGGVEIGQVCIILVAAPLLNLLCRKSAAAAGRTVTVGSLCVITAGAFWFFQRTIG